ncbi:MAG: acyl-CoA dehydrogenase [Nitrospinae bacterium RIFCSPLOWO2_12_39_15]|nr:MAG: acyl-CoA dehydrogenase [Nitrospinae bacterium RIFCSPHIGHO2_12_FULL_39_42]OGW11887.1 MAG: acyl-CoA dehydrogenase [Nitrospinae bacterium RIFCSPLOWO2_12_39_15]HLA48880.1 acyl-CoA dehydrogenase [Nitrospinota bacterium]
MNLYFTEEQKMIQQLTRKFASDKIKPLSEKIDTTGDVPSPLINEMAGLGLMGITIPEEYGGGGMDTVCYSIAMEEIARVCASTSTIVTVNNSLVCEPIFRYGTEGQKKKFLTPLAKGEMLGCFALTEAGAGSDAAAIKTSAVKEGNEYIIDGSKLFVSNGKRAQVVIVFAVTDAGKGHRGISAFIVEKKTPGLSLGRVEKKLGIKGSETVELIFERCHIPKENLLGKEGDGFKIAMNTLDMGRIGIAAQSVGIAQACLDEAIRYSVKRVQFGKPIAQLQAIQFMIADIAIEIEAARLLTYRAAYMKDKRLKFIKESSMAKLYASETANRCAYRALQIHGGYGYTKDFPLERYYRDARVTTLYEGTSEIQRLTIAKELLK